MLPILPSKWWGAVKKIAEMVPASRSEDLRSQLHLKDIEDLSVLNRRFARFGDRPQTEASEQCMIM